MIFLKKYLLWFVLAVSLLLFGYAHAVKTGDCDAPIVYSLGTFDPRFNISKADFLRDVEAATHPWENSLGKNLFEYEGETKAPLAGLVNGVKATLQKYVGVYFTRQPVVINLIYDERQQLAEQHAAQVSAINQTKETVDQVKQQFLALQNQYESSKSQYQFLLNEYKQRRGDYNTLEAKRLEVNGLADEVNALIKKYNFLVRSVNSTIQTVNQTAGQEFEEGLYVSDSSGEKINIYEFTNQESLVRVLSHELGHALGLDHNSNPDSIMYYLNNSKNITPTKEDIAAAKAICKAK